MIHAWVMSQDVVDAPDPWFGAFLVRDDPALATGPSPFRRLSARETFTHMARSARQAEASTRYSAPTPTARHSRSTRRARSGMDGWRRAPRSPPRRPPTPQAIA